MSDIQVQSGKKETSDLKKGGGEGGKRSGYNRDSGLNPVAHGWLHGARMLDLK